MKIFWWVVLAVLGLNVLFLASAAVVSLVGRLVRKSRDKPHPPGDIDG